MKYDGVLLAVKDIEKAKVFYTDIMEQKIGLDLGVHVSFSSGFSLQSNYTELVGENIKPLTRENNFQLYFEVDDIQAWFDKLKGHGDIEFVHSIKEYPWGQKGFRIYDVDEHLIEISESMESVALRCLQSGMSLEEASEKTMLPIPFLKQIQKNHHK